MYKRQAQEVTLQQLYQGYGVPLAVLAETPACFLVVGDTPYLGTHIITGQDGGTYPLEAYGEEMCIRDSLHSVVCRIFLLFVSLCRMHR